MDIIVEDISSYIADSRGQLKALTLVREVCRAKPSGYMFMKKYKSGMWDGYISLMQSFSKFPTGLLPIVTAKLEHAGYKCSVVDTRIKLSNTPISKNDLRGIELRDYQIKASLDMIRAVNGVAKMATNSGKTEVMATILKSLGLPKSVIIVHRKELMYQTANRFRTRLGIKVGMMGDGKFTEADIMVCMIQTLARRDDILELFGNNRVVMVDECQHLSNDQMLDILSVLPGSYRYGFSGTPLRHDVLSDMKLIAYTGDIVTDISNKELIDAGYSARPVVNVYSVKSKNQDNWELKYQDAYSGLIVNNRKRNKIISKIAKGNKGVVLILVNIIEHGRILSELMEGSTFVHGSHSTDYRQNVLDFMKLGGNGIYIASPIFDEGIDVPDVNCVILAGGGKS